MKINCIISIVLFVMVIIAFAYKTGKGWMKSARTYSSSSSKDREGEIIERAIAAYEQKFLGSAITQMMSERNTPFNLRHEVWKRYPRVYCDPVVGVSSLSEDTGFTAQQTYLFLTEWFLKKGIPFAKGDVNGDCLRRYLHGKAEIEASKILDDFSTMIKAQ